MNGFCFKGFPKIDSIFLILFISNLSEPVNYYLPTNQRAEIQAATRAIEQAQQLESVERLVIKTDSQFLITSMEQWIDEWKRNDSMKDDGTEVVNHRDFRALDEVIQNSGMEISWEHVRAHRGRNKKADRLVREGVERFKELHYNNRKVFNQDGVHSLAKGFFPITLQMLIYCWYQS